MCMKHKKIFMIVHANPYFSYVHMSYYIFCWCAAVHALISLTLWLEAGLGNKC